MTTKGLAVKYWYTVILLLEIPNPKGGISSRTFKRESGFQFATTPANAAAIVEKDYNKRNYIVDSITVKLHKETGIIVLQTQKDDMTDKLPLGPIPRLPHKLAENNYDKYFSNTNNYKPRENFEVWKYLTRATSMLDYPTTLNVKEHLK